MSRESKERKLRLRSPEGRTRAEPFLKTDHYLDIVRFEEWLCKRVNNELKKYEKLNTTTELTQKIKVGHGITVLHQCLHELRTNGIFEPKPENV